MVERPSLVGPSAVFLANMVQSGRRVLAGFDFPIGVPSTYGRTTPFQNFQEALSAFGTSPDWASFFDVASRPEDVSVHRPFYPRQSRKGVQRATLTSGLGVESYRDLLRSCERGGSDRCEACSVFRTLGGNQVGRAAISGWQEVVRPALADGARLWPFEWRTRIIGRAWSHDCGDVSGRRLRCSRRAVSSEREQTAPSRPSW